MPAAPFFTKKKVMLLALFLTAVIVGLYIYLQPKNPIVKSIEIVAVGLKKGNIYVRLSVEVENPSNHDVYIEGGHIKVYLGEQFLGEAHIVRGGLAPAGQTTSVLLDLSISNQDGFKKLLGDIAAGVPLSIRYSGKIDVKAGPVPMSIDVSGETSIDQRWDMFSVDSVYSRGDMGIVKLVAKNPFNIDVEIENATGYIYYGSTKIAMLVLSSPTSLPANSSVSFETELDLIDIGGVVESVLSNRNITLKFQGNVFLSISDIGVSIPLSIEKEFKLGLEAKIWVGRIILGQTLIINGKASVIDRTGVLNLPVRCKSIKALIKKGNKIIGNVVMRDSMVFPLKNATVSLELHPTGEGLGILIGQILSDVSKIDFVITHVNGELEVLGKTFRINATASINATAYIKSAIYAFSGSAQKQLDISAIYSQELLVTNSCFETSENFVLVDTFKGVGLRPRHNK